MAADPASLDNLIDIVLPTPVPAWPPAPGWYVAAAAAAVLVTWGAWRTWRRWRAAGYRRAALAELEGLRQQAGQDGTPAVALQALAPLADVAYDPAACARLDASATAALFRVVRRWIEEHVVLTAT